MVFSKPIFLFGFLPIVLLLYYAVPGKLKNTVLLIMSLIFYAWGEPRLVLLMAATILIDYVCGLLIQRFRTGDRRAAARCVMIGAIVINLGFLCYFKYANFIIENINSLFKAGFDPLNVLLPIGISFYTFQTMSYIIDVYKQSVHAEKNIISFAAYVTLFPQLIAGPIVQYKTVASELSSRKHTAELFADGVWRFSVGLAKKVVIANQIGAIWSGISEDAAGLTSGKAWLGAIAFMFQIYFDFSGYSDMAVGMGKMFGFHFPENFDHPYSSKNITDFWRRWHMTLGGWFREYVYIPLGGNRKGIARQIFNIMLVWALTGLWHGASWNFAAWGLFYGIILVLEKLFLLKFLDKIPAFLSHIYSLALILIGWVIFECGAAFGIGTYLKAMLGIGVKAWSGETTYILQNYGILFIIAALCSAEIISRLGARWFKSGYRRAGYWRAAGAAMLLILSIIFIAGDNYDPFLYFRF